MNQERKLKVIQSTNKLGRPRDTSRDLVIIDTTLRHLTLYGYEALSTTEIAKDAGVSKATIYRRWPSKRFLIIDAFKTLPKLEVPNTGSLEGDLKDLSPSSTTDTLSVSKFSSSSVAMFNIQI